MPKFLEPVDIDVPKDVGFMVKAPFKWGANPQGGPQLVIVSNDSRVLTVEIGGTITIGDGSTPLAPGETFR